jgi:hypothetical protein
MVLTPQRWKWIANWTATAATTKPSDAKMARRARWPKLGMRDSGSGSRRKVSGLGSRDGGVRFLDSHPFRGRQRKGWGTRRVCVFRLPGPQVRGTWGTRGEGCDCRDGEVGDGGLVGREDIVGGRCFGAKGLGEAVGGGGCGKWSSDGLIRIGWQLLCKEFRVEIIGN